MLERNKNNRIIRIGCAESTQSLENYGHVERTHAVISIILRNLACVSLTVICLLPGMIPISYAVFEYPPPELWALVIEIQ